MLVVCEGVRSTLMKAAMDYLIAGIAAVFVFVYLIVALLRPERF
jgi:K+-transporting ATPase KdpF subunit